MLRNLGLIFVGFLLSIQAFASFKAPLILGHRGACGHRPEHTLESYKLAIEMGADYVEPDLVMTKDKVLMARHENEISGTTDVATKFPDRKTTKTVDGVSITGWFIEDFTMKEIKTLKAKERLEFRSRTYDGQFDIPTFSEILELVKKESAERKKQIGIYPETKHPTYFTSIGLPLEEALVAELKKFHLNRKNAPVFIQSFELGNLKKLKELTPLPLVFLIDDPEMIPYDYKAAGLKTTYQELLTPKNLKEIKKIASGIGPYKRYIIPANDKNERLPATTLIKDAHDAGLFVHAYTFRSEERFLLKDYNNDPQQEYIEFFKLGVDGVFSDFTDDAVKAKEAFLKMNKSKEKK